MTEDLPHGNQEPARGKQVEHLQDVWPDTLRTLAIEVTPVEHLNDGRAA